MQRLQDAAAAAQDAARAAQAERDAAQSVQRATEQQAAAALDEQEVCSSTMLG